MFWKKMENVFEILCIDKENFAKIMKNEFLDINSFKGNDKEYIKNKGLTEQEYNNLIDKISKNIK